MNLRSTRKVIATMACLLAIGSATADVKQHTRTSEEEWDYEVTAKAVTWTVEAHSRGGFSLRIPEADPSCPGKRLRTPAGYNGPVTSLFNIFFTARSMDAELAVRYRKAIRQTYEPR